MSVLGEVAWLVVDQEQEEQEVEQLHDQVVLQVAEEVEVS